MKEIYDSLRKCMLDSGQDYQDDYSTLESNSNASPDELPF